MARCSTDGRDRTRQSGRVPHRYAAGGLATARTRVGAAARGLRSWIGSALVNRVCACEPGLGSGTWVCARVPGSALVNKDQLRNARDVMAGCPGDAADLPAV